MVRVWIAALPKYRSRSFFRVRLMEIHCKRGKISFRFLLLPRQYRQPVGGKCRIDLPYRRIPSLPRSHFLFKSVPQQVKRDVPAIIRNVLCKSPFRIFHPHPRKTVQCRYQANHPSNSAAHRIRTAYYYIREECLSSVPVPQTRQFRQRNYLRKQFLLHSSTQVSCRSGFRQCLRHMFAGLPHSPENNCWILYCTSPVPRYHRHVFLKYPPVPGICSLSLRKLCLP